MILLIALFSIFALSFGFTLLWFVSKSRKHLGILTNERLYQDTNSFPGETIVSKTLPLKGKPDYILKTKDKKIIPVELKMGKTPQTPYANHVMQLIAYCYLVEEKYNTEVPFGVLKYQEKEFEIEYNAKYKKMLKSLIEEMLENKKAGKELHCSHTKHYL